jgi:diguanylate cyclase (GGDEF)-like protein
VLILDLDGFKHINDTLGHLMGDKVLVEVARRIQRALRETDTLARIGGDEFMIVVEGLEEQGDLQQVATKVLEHVQQPMPIDNAELFVTTSIGITLFPDDGQGIGELFANADTALYRAKAEGRNVFRFFTAQMHAAAVARMAIETELRRAIPNDEFELHYQPVVELASGKLAKAEALVRWRHPERGLVPPNDFIPVAEDTGMILPLGAWIVGEAARQAAAWDALSPDEFKICVNFSAYQFRRSDPLALLAESLAASGIGSGHLAIEITESLFMEDEGGALDQLHLLRAEGFEIAIDDFGTGYSSLSYLQRLPIDTLKIDRSFIRGIPDDPKSMALIDAMLSLGAAFGIAVIAEGVETATQADFLRERGCRYGQGYYFGKPLAAAEFARARFATAAT